MLRLVCLVSLIVGVTFSVPAPKSNEEEKCGYDSCTQHQADVLNVHIVAHTHDDVGWLKTVDQYYYGGKNYIQKAGVQYILDSVIKELWEDPKRRFIYVETAFFWKWWVRQTSETQDRVHTLVRQGRLQFVGGAWSMNDEAAAHYHSIIDQFTHGLKRLKATFGECGIPHTGWQIDPFGHSREFASLLANMGYDGLFLGRIDYQDKDTRAAHKTMEMVWRGDDDLGHSSDIFTSVLYNQYQPPPGFCFDILCSDEPIVDDPNSPDFNVDDRVDNFLALVRNMSSRYVSNNVLVTMGDDFNYQDAGMWFTNLDKLIQYTNLKAGKDDLGIKVFYSTPDCYLKAVKDANPTLPTKCDDFFPYASDPTAYWSGYFTSRPNNKHLERRANAALQMVKQIQVLANLERHYNFVVDTLRAAMGVMQHHDAITGTEKQHVARDYVRIVSSAVNDAHFVLNRAYEKISSSSEDSVKPPLVYQQCAINETSCEVSQKSDNFIVNIYNVLAWSRKHVVRIPVDSDEVVYIVTDPEGKTVKSVVQPTFEGFKNVYAQSEPADYELVFLSELPPLGYINYFISKQRKDNFIKKREARNDFDIYNDYIKSFKDSKKYKGFKRKVYVSKYVNEERDNDGDWKPKIEKNMKFDDFDLEERRMLSDDPMIIQRYDDVEVATQAPRHNSNEKYTVKHSIKYYPACAGDNGAYVNRSSGAYILRPNTTEPIAINIVSKNLRENIFGKEYLVVLSNNASYIVRINNDHIVPYHEIEYMVGPIDIDDDVGKEFVVQHQVEINNNGVFYTDSNSRQMIKRIKDHRPQWNVSLLEPVPGNYYPITSKITLDDEKVKLTVLTDRSAGGTSMKQGLIEVMVHRRLLSDDAFGVGEALNESLNGNGLIVRGIHKFMITEAKVRNVDEADQIRKIEIGAQYEPILTFAEANNLTVKEWKKMQNSFTGLNKLPKGLHILTLEQWDDKNLLLLRLENILSTDLGLPHDDLVTRVNVTEIFNDFTIKTIQETLLGANRIDLHEPWDWNVNENWENELKEGKVSDDDDKTKKGIIVLAPREIRTFIIEFEFVKK